MNINELARTLPVKTSQTYDQSRYLRFERLSDRHAAFPVMLNHAAGQCDTILGHIIGRTGLQVLQSACPMASGDWRVGKLNGDAPVFVDPTVTDELVRTVGIDANGGLSVIETHLLNITFSK